MREIVRQKQRKTSLSSTGTKIIIYTILCLAAVTTIFPYLWMVLASLKTGIEISTYPEQIFPKNPSFTAYRRAFEELNLWVGIKNTLVLVVFAVLFPPVVSAMGAFSFAKLVLPAKRVLLLVLLSSMMVPYAALMLPQYQIWQSLGFVGTLWPLIIPNFFGGALMTFFFIQYMQGVPTDLFEAAKIDGAGYLNQFFAIMLPLVKPALSAQIVFAFVGTWNDYFMQLIMLKSSDAITVSLGIARLQSEFATNYGLMMAGATLGAVPIVAVFICFQKYFTQGITMGAVKG